MPKPFMTYEQQIQKLQDKNLIIQNVDDAKNVLHQLGYFSLITGYKDLFKNSTTKNYRDGTTFQDILSLYIFDRDLRSITLPYLLQIEKHIRSALSYAFCEINGDDQAAYTFPGNYDFTSLQKQRQINELIQKYILSLLNHKTDYPYIEHYKNAHGTVPLWVLINAVTFGTLSKMYSLSKPKVQTRVSNEFQGVNEHQLSQMLQVLTSYRNVCAHGDRLFSYRCSRYEIPDLLLHQKLAIPQKGTQYIYGKRDFFALILCFRYLLPHKEFLQFKKCLIALIEKVVSENHQVSRDKLLQLMGMPQNWKKITAFKKI